MYIENDVVIWKTDSAHVEVYDVRLVASDGFERTVQELNCFPGWSKNIIETSC